MHASHEPAAVPPADRPPAEREKRAGKIIAMSVALLMMVLATFGIISASPQAASAQQPVIADLTGSCDTADAAKALFVVSMVNEDAVQFDFIYRITYFPTTDTDGFQQAEASVAAGDTFNHTFLPQEHFGQPTWRVDFFGMDGTPVGSSNEIANPCADESTTDETTTDESTTDESTTEESTTEESTSESESSEESSPSETTTDTDPFGNNVDVTTTNTDIAPAANNSGSGGGLAQTGVAVVVLIGGAAVLLFNGIGLSRMSRRGFWLKDED